MQTRFFRLTILLMAVLFSIPNRRATQGKLHAKKTLLVTILILVQFMSFAQTPLNTFDNYFAQKETWNMYYDSVRAANYALGDSSMQGTGYSSFKRWESYWDMFMPSSGSFSDAKQIQNAYRRYAQTEHFEQLTAGSGQQFLLVDPTNWTEIGPYNLSSVYGKYNSIWYNPHLNNDGSKKYGGHVAKIDRIFVHPSNQQILYALGGGMDHGGGGLYKSIDSGNNWTILGTDQIPNADVMTFAIKPTGELPEASMEYLFIGLSTGATYRSDDNGVTWLECGYNGTVSYPYVFNSNPTNSLPYSYDYYNATSYWAEVNSKFQFTKSSSLSGDFSRLVVARAGGIYYSDNYNAAITPDSSNYTLTNSIVWSKFNLAPFENSIGVIDQNTASRQFVYTDFEYYIKGNDTTYIATVQVRELDSNGNILGFVKHYVCSSTDFGATWSFFAGTGLTNEPHGENVSSKSFTTCNIEVYRENPSYVYVAGTYTQGISLDVSKSYHLKRYGFSTNTWTDYSVYDSFPNTGMATQPNAFAVDPNIEGDWWFYTNAADRYTNGSLLDYSGPYSSLYHADVRDILVLNNGTIVAATDGGVYQSTDSGQTFDATSEGIGGAHSDQMAVAQDPPFYVASGFWHSGLQVYNPETEKWHWGSLGDGKLGEIFFLNNQRYSMSDQSSTSRVIRDFDEFEFDFIGGPIVGSENIEGRSYTFRRNAPDDILSYNNDDMMPTTSWPYNPVVNSTSVTFPIYTVSPIVVPNEPDLVGAIYLNGNTQKIKFYSGANQSTPNLVFDSEIDLYAINGNSPSSFGGICFDTRRNGKHWIILKSYPDWGGSGLGRIVEYNTATSSYDDITFVTDDNINGQSPGFPDFLHINSIELDRQTGVLYIGTTNGVYYLDRGDEIWRKYSVNVPLLNTKLGIVHCTGELYASAQNRGIWKTDLIRNSNTPDLSWDISSNETWNDRMNLFCTLTVKTGATLIVNEDIVVYGNQKIIVEPGARLVVQDSAIITSNCDAFWSGIEVWGDVASLQQASYQGMVTITGGASIQNATNAIRVWKPGDWNSMGGIVQATNASFINNKRDIEFMPYSGSNVGSTAGNLSYFTQCEFKTDTNYMGTVIAPHVSMYKVDGVRFTACDFSDERTVDASLKNKGIHALDAKFKVLGKFIGSSPSQVDYYDDGLYDPCTFTNLTYGIWAGSANTQNAVMVDQSLFTDCEYGIALSQSDNAVISRNQFDRTSASAWFGYQYDIYTNKSTAYFVEGNLMIAQSGADPVIGVTSENSGLEDNEVRRNKMTNVDHATFGYGLNKNALSADSIAGLEYLCNTYSANHVQDEIFAGTVSGHGVKVKQGLEDSPAGNEFTDTTGSALSFNLNSALSTNTRYYYYTGSSGDVENPDAITTSTVTKIGTQANPECASHFDKIIPRHGAILSSSTVSENLLSDYDGHSSDLADALFDLGKAEDPEEIEKIEEDIIRIRREMNRISNFLIKEAVFDSTLVDSAQFVTWIHTRNDALRFPQLVDYYWSVGDTNAVNAHLDSINNYAETLPEGDLQTELNDFKNYKTTMKSLVDRYGILQGLDSTSEATLRTIISTKTGMAKVQAQNILCYFLGECQTAPTPPIAGEKGGSETFEPEALQTMAEALELHLYPNPTSGSITVNLDTEALPLTIRIFDLEGRERLATVANSNNHLIDVSHLGTGSYFVVVTDRGGTVYMKKMVKN